MTKNAESIAQSTHGRVMQKLRSLAECLGSGKGGRVPSFSCASSSEGSESQFGVRQPLGNIPSKSNLLKIVMMSVLLGCLELGIVGADIIHFHRLKGAVLFLCCMSLPDNDYPQDYTWLSWRCAPLKMAVPELVVPNLVCRGHHSENSREILYQNRKCIFLEDF